MVDWGGAKSDQVEAVVRDLCDYLSVEVPAIHVEPPEQVPGSYHKLLVHNAGMTATLEAHWGQRLAVDLIADDLLVEEHSLYRFVALYTAEDEERQVVELAAWPPFALPWTPSLRCCVPNLLKVSGPSGASWPARASVSALGRQDSSGSKPTNSSHRKRV